MSLVYASYIWVHVKSHVALMNESRLSNRSQIAINIRPAPGEKWFMVGPFDWREYDYTFFLNTAPLVSICSPPTEIQKQVRWKQSKRALCDVCT